MTKGIITELPELIALQRCVQTTRFQPERFAHQLGPYRSRLRGRGMDFSEARNYQAGDEIRHMEWRVTARTGRPHVKVFHEERERPVVIVTDFNPSMYFGTRIAFKSVVAARLSALLAWAAAKQGDRVGGLLFSCEAHTECIPRSRKAGVLPFLQALSQYTRQLDRLRHETEPRSLSQALIRLRRVAKPGSLLVLVSDFYTLDADTEQHLSRLRSHNELLVYHVCDPLELAPPKPAQYAITDGQQELLLDTTLDAVRFEYQFYCEQRIAMIRGHCKRLQIHYTNVTAETDLPMLVRQTFPRRALGG